MPPSRPFGFPTTHPSFLKHRYHDGPRSLPLKIHLSFPTPVPARASLPTPPMSGTPPPEPSSNPSQLAGRRRKREDTPPPTSQDPSQLITTGINISPLVEQAPTLRYGDPPRTGRASDQTMLPSPHLMPWEHHSGFMAGGGQGYTLVTSHLTPRPPQVSPRATRKVKAHVASACVNCKRKHLRCDEARPCRRCVQSGKEDTCRDVEHKKRGRPPLKEPGVEGGRGLHSGVTLPPLGSSSRTGSTSGLVPLLPTPTPSRMPYAPSYAPPSIAQSSATAQGQFSSLQRPLSFPPARQQIQQAPHAGSAMSASAYGYNPPMQSMQAYQTSDYPTPLFPRRSGPSQSLMNPTTATYGPPPLQLPPILPAPPGTNIDPAMAQQHRYSTTQIPQQGQPPPSRISVTQSHTETDERDSKRPKMDMRNILGPRE